MLTSTGLMPICPDEVGTTAAICLNAVVWNVTDICGRAKVNETTNTRVAQT
jgi:hypothetical protein